MSSHYSRTISTVEAAKMIRAALKSEFPGVRFSVRCDHGSIRINWTDGPTRAAVDAVVQVYRGEVFDGSIDSSSFSRHYITPQGEVSVASISGTQGSGGYIEPQEFVRPHDDAVLVRFAVRFVFTEREYSQRMLERGLAWYAERYPDHSLRINADARRPWLVSDDRAMNHEDVSAVYVKLSEQDGPRGVQRA